MKYIYDIDYLFCLLQATKNMDGYVTADSEIGKCVLSMNKQMSLILFLIKQILKL